MSTPPYNPGDRVRLIGSPAVHVVRRCHRTTDGRWLVVLAARGTDTVVMASQVERA